MGNLSGKIRIETDDNQIYEGTLSLVSPLIASCAEIVAYNDLGVVLKWQLYLGDGTKIYESGKYTAYETCKIHLDDLGLPENTYITLKAAITGADDKTADRVILYNSNGGTDYFGYFSPIGLERRLSFYCNVPSNETPPVLKCTKIKFYHTGAARERWKLISDGSEIYSTGVQTNGDKTEKDLRTLSIVEGTRIIVKAAVVGGVDSSAYVILEYSPNSNTMAWVNFAGNAFKNFVMLDAIGEVF